jgi:hypothetical protein
MSIDQTIATLRRANAAVSAANAAKRGMFALVETRGSSTYVHGTTKHYLVYTPAVVSKCGRDGMAKECRTADGRKFTQCDWLTVLVDSRGSVKDPAAVCAKLVDDFGLAIAYETRERATDAIKGAAGLS